MVLIKALGLLSTVALALAGGSIDNSDDALLVSNNAMQYTDGMYRITNYATKKQLSFVRGNGVTNFELVPHGKGEPVELQFTNDGRVRISGGNNKCASAQWDKETDGGVDHAAVSYACSVGKDTSGNASLEKTKQWWYLVSQNDASSVAKRSEPKSADKRSVKKRLNTGEAFYIVPSDHLHDMKTRAMVGSMLRTYGGYISVTVDNLVKGDKSQLWVLEKA